MNIYWSTYKNIKHTGCLFTEILLFFNGRIQKTKGDDGEAYCADERSISEKEINSKLKTWWIETSY
jgi:hypothetical protein